MSTLLEQFDRLGTVLSAALRIAKKLAGDRKYQRDIGTQRICPVCHADRGSSHTKDCAMDEFEKAAGYK